MKKKIARLLCVACCVLLCACGDGEVADVENPVVLDTNTANEEPKQCSLPTKEEKELTQIKEEEPTKEDVKEVKEIAETKEAIETAEEESAKVTEESDNADVQSPEVFFSAVEETVYATTAVNVRRLPTKDSERIAALSYGEQVTRIGVGDNGWSRVLYQDAEYYINSSYLATEKPEEKKASSPVANAYIGTVILKDGNVDDRFVNIVAEQFALIPENVRNFIIGNGGMLYVTDKNIDKVFFGGYYGSVQGVALIDEYCVYLEDREKACVTSTTHECGHLLDYGTEMGSLSDEFVSIYEAEKSAMRPISTAHGISNSMEYFADAFRNYVKNGNELATRCPQTYAYIENLVENL